MNLVKNALKFTKSGKIEIKASYRRAENLLVVHVKDTGKGIEKNGFSQLFNRFGKLQRTAEDNNEGIGLGLTIVKQIVELSGGAVGVESEGVDCGSLFSFSMKMDSIKETDISDYEQKAIEDSYMLLPGAQIVDSYSDERESF